MLKTIKTIGLGIFVLTNLTIGSLIFCGPSHAADTAAAKNIIIMIIDGCGFNQIAATDLYQFGHLDRQVYEQFPVKAAVSTFSIDGNYDARLAWANFNYVKDNSTDSAAAATALATGHKTTNTMLGMDRDKKPLRNLVEAAHAQGKSSGVITTVPWSHATPAGFVVHEAKRDNYETIAKQMVYESSMEVIMGAGHPLYNNDGVASTASVDYKYVGGESTWQALNAGTAGGDIDGDGKPDPWRLIQTREAFRALAQGDTPRRVLGTALVQTTLQQSRSGNSRVPFDLPRAQSVPTLVEMTRAALNVLGHDPDGLFLMVEGGAVDWACHGNQSARLVEELMDFNQAADAVVEWVETHSSWKETLVVITADHETGYLLGPGSDPCRLPLEPNELGKLPGMQWYSQGHTNSLVPLFAKGVGVDLLKQAATGCDAIRGDYLDNTSIAQAAFQVIEGAAKN